MEWGVEGREEKNPSFGGPDQQSLVQGNVLGPVLRPSRFSVGDSRPGDPKNLNYLQKIPNSGTLFLTGDYTPF